MFNKFKGEILLFLPVLFWGSSYSAVEIALESYNAFEIIFLRFIISSVFLGIFCIFLRGMNFKSIIKSNNTKYGFILGFFLFFGFVFQTLGLQFTTVAKNAFISSLSLVFIPIISVICTKKPLDLFDVIGIVFALMGTAFITLEKDFSINKGDVLSLICALFFAFHVFLTGKYCNETDTLLLTTMQMVTVALLSCIILIVTGSSLSFDNNKATISIVYLSVVATSLAFLLQTKAQKYISPTKAAIFLSFEAIVATIISVIVLKDTLTTNIIIGSILITLGITAPKIKPKTQYTSL